MNRFHNYRPVIDLGSFELVDLSQIGKSNILIHYNNHGYRMFLKWHCYLFQIQIFHQVFYYQYAQRLLRYRHVHRCYR